MSSRQILVRGVATVAFLFAAFSGFLKGIAPPEEGPFSIGIASLLALCILLLLSFSIKGKSKAARKAFCLRVAVALTITGCAAALCYWTLRGKLTFPYPPENPQDEYIAGIHYTPRAETWARNTGQSANQVVAKFGGLSYRNRVWSDASIAVSKIILIGSYLVFVLSAAGAVFSLTELTAVMEADRAPALRTHRERGGG
jgi:hypothetical protein